MRDLIPAIIDQLEHELATAIKASQQAHSSATHSENIAENKYDTLAVEAAYLAHGQSMRIEELQASMTDYQRFKRTEFTQQSTIQLGALVDIESDKGEVKRVFIGPAAGGLRIESKPYPIQVITASTPLGHLLINKHIDDEVVLTVGQSTQQFCIIDIQ